MSAFFEEFAGEILSADPSRRYRLRQSIDLAANPPAQRVWEVSERQRIGPWIIDRSTRGGYVWRVSPDATIHELHDFRAIEHGSVRARNGVRVILLGESAAGSFGHWGTFSLASAIKDVLQGYYEDRPVEVIDLTCINALWDRCNNLLAASETLNPDFAVIYCGNNEAKNLYQRAAKGALPAYAHRFEARWGVSDLHPAEWVEALNELLSEHITRLSRDTLKICSDIGVSPLFVLPPANLKDWLWPQVLPFHLKSKNLAEWIEQANLAKEALTRLDLNTAFLHLKKAVQMDGAMCQLTQRLLAQTLLAAGDIASAKRHFIASKDAGPGPFFGGHPCLPQRGMDALKEELNRQEASYVDLPAILEKSSPDGIPGSNYFLDYCHLTASGITVAATNIGRELAAADGLKDLPKPNIEIRQPTAQETAWTALVACLHNFHYDQPLDLVRFWMQRSLASGGQTSEFLRWLLPRLRSSNREATSLPMLKKQLPEPANSGTYLFFLAKFFYHARFDVDLEKIIVETIGIHRPTTGANAKVRPRTYPTGSSSIELLSLFYSDRGRGLAPRLRPAARTGWEQLSSDIVATLFTSQLDFDCTPSRNRKLTLRAVADERTLSVIVKLNGHFVGSATIEGDAETHVFQPRRTEWCEGLNQVTIEWNELVCLYDEQAPHLIFERFERFGIYPTSCRLISVAVS